MNGLSMRVGSAVDAVQPTCVGVKLLESSGDYKVVQPMRGGRGGGPLSISCPSFRYTVRGITVGHGGMGNRVVNTITLICARPDGSAGPFEAPIVRFTGRPERNQESRTFMCPKGELAVGIYGRTAAYLGSIGLICAPTPFRG
jgi:hypothetical protein